MTKHKFLSLLSISIIGPLVIGCGPRRTTTVDPLPDPAFRDISGSLEYRAPTYKTKPSGAPPSTSVRKAEQKGPWTIRRLSKRWKYIIVHHSATKNGGAKRFDRSHRNNGWDELGYHFVIGNGSDTPDGKIEVGSRWPIQKHGAHCRVSPDDDNEYNKHGIGICLVGDFRYRPPSHAQMRSLIYLTKGLLAYTHLPPSAVHFHRDFDSTECPGAKFPYAAYKQAVRR